MAESPTSISDLTAAMGIGSPSLYAAFTSKEALYLEALDHYVANYETLVWERFRSAATAREAVEVFLMDSAAALSGSVADIPVGCMVTLSAVGSEGHEALGDRVRKGRAITFERMKERLEAAVAAGEMSPCTDADALARYVQAVQNGMSILARDGANRADLEAVARVACATIRISCKDFPK